MKNSRNKLIVLTLFFTSGLFNLYAFQIADRDPDHMYPMIFTDQVELALASNPFYKTGTVFKDPKIMYYKQFYKGLYISVGMSIKNLMMAYPSASSVKIDGLVGMKRYDLVKMTDFSSMSISQKKEFSDYGNTLSILRQTMGDYAGAESLLKKCMDIRRELFGTRSKTFLNSLFNLSVFYVQTGNYSEAQNLMSYLDRSFKSIYTDNSAEYALLKNNLGMLYANLGRNEQALASLNIALEKGADNFDNRYIDLERVMVNKALLLEASGDPLGARNLYEKAILGMEEKGFDDHPGSISISVQLSKLFIRSEDPGAYAYVSETHKRALKRYGDNHPLYAKSLSNEADYFMNKNSFQEAYDIFERISKIQKSVLGENHMDYLNTLSKMAICQWQLNNIDQAQAHFKESIDNYLFLVENTFKSLSETEKSKFWQTLKPRVETFMSFAISNADKNPQLLEEVYNLHIKTKGLLISSTNSVKNGILGSDDQELIDLYDQWITSKEDLAYYYSSAKEVAEADEIDIESLEKYTNNLERELNIRSSIFQNQSEKPLDVNDIRNSLSGGEAAMEIIRISTKYGEDKGQVLYYGLMTQPSKEGLKIMKIPNGENLETRALKAYKNSIKFKIDDQVSYDAFWNPFKEGLIGINRLYLSVDGAYNLINLNTLQKEGQYILDEIDLVLLSNTKYIKEVKDDLVELGISSTNTLLGFPEFGDEKVVPPLPGTRVEISTIDSIMKSRAIPSTVFMKDLASKDNLLAVHNPTILHIATHGYFLQDASGSNDLLSGIQLNKSKTNPLLRSGLMLSGAADVLRPEEGVQTGQDGIINAYEVMNIDLSKTELVVLSACETGTGEVVNGEGVYGLPRAFQVAGADAIIMSLWKVDDLATKDLMSIFYEKLLVNKDINISFAEAQKEVRIKYNHPYYWGAFVLLN